MPNHYETLGVSQDADDNEIKKAYRKLSLKYHPDRNQDEDATRKFQEINQAYETISDNSKRQQYDMELKFGGGGHGMNGMHNMEEFTDLNNIFNMMFGGMGIHRMGGMHGMGGMPNIHVFHNGGPGNFHAEFSTHFHQSPPPPISKTVDVTLEQSFHGISLPVEIQKWVIINNMKVNEKENIMVNIPAGMDEGDTLVLQGKGNVINENIKGDVKINIKIQNNTIFKRQGLDLILHKKISLKEALCGFSFEIPHINGKTFTLNNINNSTIIKPGFKKTIQNLGFTRENTTGNLIVEIDVEFPTSLTKEQITAISEIL